MSCARDRGPSGRGGIAGNNVVVSDRAALSVTLRAPRTIGKNFAACETIFSGIGINEQRRSAFPLGSERLEATIAVRIRVADEYDLPSHTDAVFPEEIVIFRISAVRVDDFGGDVAGSGIAEEGAGDGGIFRVRIDVVSIFTQRGGEGDRLRHFQGNAAWARVHNVVAAQRDVFPALLAPCVGDEIGEVVVACGSGGGRFGGERAVPLACFVRRRNRLKRGFDLVLGDGVRRGKTENRSGGRNVLFQLSRKREGQDQQRKK